MFLPEGVVTNERMSTADGHQRRVDPTAHGHRATPVRAQGHVLLRSRSGSGAPGPGRRASARRPTSTCRLRHDDAGPLFPGQRGPAGRPPGPRGDARSGHPDAVRRLPLGPSGCRRVYPFGNVQRSCWSGRNATPPSTPGPRPSGRSCSATPTGRSRRRRTRGAPRTATGRSFSATARGAFVLEAHGDDRRRAASSASRCAPTATTGTSSTSPAAVPRPFPTSRPEMFARERNDPGRGRAPGVSPRHDGDAARSSARSWHGTASRSRTSRCCSCTRPTCASTRRCRRASGSRTRKSSTTSRGTATRPPRRSLSSSTRPRHAGRIRPGNLVCFTALGAGLHWGAGLLRT